MNLPDSALVNSSHNEVRSFLRLLLRPVMRIMLRHGIAAYRESTEIYKATVVEVASEKFGSWTPDKYSQVAMLTGMATRDVRSCSV